MCRCDSNGTYSSVSQSCGFNTTFGDSVSKSFEDGREIRRRVFKKFVHNLYRGLESLNASVAGRCASTIDHIASYYFRHCKKLSPREKDVETARKLQQFILATSQRFFTEMLGFLFKIVLISRDKAMNQWLESADSFADVV